MKMKSLQVILTTLTLIYSISGDASIDQLLDLNSEKTAKTPDFCGDLECPKFTVIDTYKVSIACL